jgi:hypothetical protein
MKAALAKLAITTLLAACASAGSSLKADRNRITGDQLARVSVGNAYDAILRLQPQWLDSRGSRSITDRTPATAIVFMDGARGGELEFLRAVPINTLAEIRFLPPGEASARYGMGLQRGVIELISKGR